MKFRGRLAAALAPVSLLLAMAANAPATTSSEALALLTAQRQANRIGPISANADLAQSCVNHLSYLELNPGSDLIDEDPAKPGYTPLGDADPAASSVFSQGSYVLLSSFGDNWSATANPWSFGPGHTAAMFDPTITLGGYGLQPGARIQSCMRLAGFTSAPRTLAAYTGAQGRVSVPPAVTVSPEGPLPPQSVVGIPVGQTAGPVIILYAYENGRRPLSSVSRRLTFKVKGKAKRVKGVRFIQGASGTSNSTLAMHGPASALIPSTPLKPNRRYKASLVWKTSKGKRLRQNVRFTTGAG